jgi:cellulose synthase/poly-beta-1,6-N-acetylglucosamine synthase-like glycosyltransferase
MTAGRRGGPMNAQLAAARSRFSPRFAPPPTPAISVLIHGGVLMVWVALFLLAGGQGGLFAWSVGLAYLAYDTVLLLFTAWQIRRFTTAGDRPADAPVRLSVAVLVAAHNEAAVLPATIGAVLAQTDPPEEIVIADDGSTDATGIVLRAEFGLTAPGLGAVSHPVHIGATAIIWICLPQRGKAHALNAAIVETAADIAVTVDADTLLAEGAIGAVRQAFSCDPELIGVTGIITPVCRPSVAGQILQFFQVYEYIRNFLGRYAWMRLDCLQLISGAFAGFRRTAVVDVGGFDEGCLVEDYELVHRLYRYAGERGLTWRFRVLGGAQARTEAPGSLTGLLRQRRRWFGGFLQTQWWYRAMVGDPRMGRLGMVMLPIKAIDTVQPLYGLTAFALLAVFVATNQIAILGPALLIIAGKLVIDMAFQLWSVRQYRQWVDDPHRASLVAAAVATVVEPFTFRLLLQCGAMLGWLAFLSGGQRWGRQHRFGLTNKQ